MKQLAGLLAALALSTSVTAQAQANDPHTGSRLGNRLEDDKALREREAIHAVQRWATCVYFKRDRTVKRMLTTLDVDDLQNAADLVFKGVDCEIVVPGRRADQFVLNTDFASDRGLLAEAALEKEGHLKPNADILAALPMAEGYNREWFRMTTRSNVVDAMSICFAETQPALTVALLRTDRKTPEEDAAIGEIAGLLGPCLSAGASLNANIFQLRNALAEAYFQRIYGPNKPIVLDQREEETAAAGAKS